MPKFMEERLNVGMRKQRRFSVGGLAEVARYKANRRPPAVRLLEHIHPCARPLAAPRAEIGVKISQRFAFL